MTITDYEIPDEVRLSTVIGGLNRTYDYLNNPTGGEEIFYEPHTTDFNSASTTVIKAVFKVMRMWIGDNLTMYIERHEDGVQPVKLKKIQITDEIAKITDKYGEYLYDTNEKLEYQDEFDIHIVLKGKELAVVEVRINNWVISNNPDIDM